MFRASNQSVADAYANIKRQAVSTKQYMNAQIAAMQAPVSTAWIPLGIIQHLQQVIAMMDDWAATPGLPDYARTQENNQAYDVIAEYQAMRTAMVNALNALISMFPTSSGFLAYQTLAADGTISVRNFTSAQLTPVVAQCQNVTATIS